MISVKDLRKTYQTGHKTVHAVDGVSFEAKNGDFVTITGRSGSGKSTLLYQLGLLDRPTSGSIIIDGVDVLNISTSKRSDFRLRNLGYVFQDYALLPTLTAEENVMIVLQMMGISKNKALSLSDKALEQVGLYERKTNLPSQLSGGEQQRVSIARAICAEPSIIFADEPTANLDLSTAHKILDVLSNLHDKGQTIVMVTHEMEFAKLGNVRLNLSDGKLVEN